MAASFSGRNIEVICAAWVLVEVMRHILQTRCAVVQVALLINLKSQIYCSRTRSEANSKQPFVRSGAIGLLVQFKLGLKKKKKSSSNAF